VISIYTGHTGARVSVTCQLVVGRFTDIYHRGKKKRSHENVKKT